MTNRRILLAAAAGVATLSSTTASVAQGQPYVGAMMWFAGNFCPAGWAEANGQLLPISENETLFQLIGTTYGGDGQQTFATPDLRGRVAVHVGTGAGLQTRILAEQYGSEQVTLLASQMPVHSHTASTPLVMRAAAGNGQTAAPTDNALADPRTARIYSTAPANVDMDETSLSAQTTVSQTGGNQPFDNMQPYLTITACISLFGVFPSPQ